MSSIQDLSVNSASFGKRIFAVGSSLRFKVTWPDLYSLSSTFVTVTYKDSYHSTSAEFRTTTDQEYIRVEDDSVIIDIPPEAASNLDPEVTLASLTNSLLGEVGIAFSKSSSAPVDYSIQGDIQWSDNAGDFSNSSLPIYSGGHFQIEFPGPTYDPPAYLGEVDDETAMLQLDARKADWCKRTDLNNNFVLTGDDPEVLENWTAHSNPASAVTSVSGKTGAVTLDKSDVGLPEVDNTKDVDKPVSTAQGSAIATRAPSSVIPDYLTEHELSITGGVISFDLSAGVHPFVNLTEHAVFDDFTGATPGIVTTGTIRVFQRGSSPGFSLSTAGTQRVRFGDMTDVAAVDEDDYIDITYITRDGINFDLRL